MKAPITFAKTYKAGEKPKKAKKGASAAAAAAAPSVLQKRGRDTVDTSDGGLEPLITDLSDRKDKKHKRKNTLRDLPWEDCGEQATLMQTLYERSTAKLTDLEVDKGLEFEGVRVVHGFVFHLPVLIRVSL
jgi:hypothetical protein